MKPEHITDNSDRVKREAEKKIGQALKIIGMKAESYAKALCPVDTGLLRNSITFALDGEEPATTSYKDNKDEQEGLYSGVAPEEQRNQRSVMVGSNVQYAPYQELGAPNINLPARPFIRPAIENHMDEYKQVVEQTLGDL